MIPYIHIESFHIGSLRFATFSALMGLGTLAGFAAALFRGTRLGLPARRIEEMCLWAIVAGYVGAHAAGWLYEARPLSTLLEEPWLFFSAGLASAGAFAGAIAGLTAFFLKTRAGAEERWKYADALGFALPFGWMVGRIGCALVHDHPGIVTSSFLAVRYPDAPRYDLGLLEVLFLAVLGCAFLWLARTARPPGFFFGAFLLPYGLFRMGIEPLRAETSALGGFNTDQWAWSVPVFFGAWALARAVQARRIEG